MTKQQLWDYYIKKNPSFAAEGGAKLTPEKLRKFFDITFDYARDQGFERGKGWEKKTQENEKLFNIGNVFDDIFGTGKYPWQ